MDTLELAKFAFEHGEEIDRGLNHISLTGEDTAVLVYVNGSLSGLQPTLVKVVEVDIEAEGGA
jgi:hypothetical protein